jgi:hypothetical protein
LSFLAASVFSDINSRTGVRTIAVVDFALMCENNLRCSSRRRRRSEVSKVDDRLVTAGREEEKISEELCEGQS